MKYLVPLSAFVVLVVLLAFGLGNNPRIVPSPLLHKPAPAFIAPLLLEQGKVSSEQMLGKIWVLNVWASWCAGCLDEHAVLTQWVTEQQLPTLGLNYKDTHAKAEAWLKQWGNPYSVVALDPKGDIGLEWGVYGVPETFIIDQKGIIRYKHIGSLTEAVVREQLNPLIQQLRGQP